MDGSPLPSVVVFIVCLIGSMICSTVETAFSLVGGTKRAKMMNLADNGDKRARRVLTVLDRFDSALSANLICNNVFNICCATAATVIAMSIGGGGAVAVATALSTLIIFFSAEMLPKKFAKDCPELVALSCAPLVLFAISVLRPFTAVLTAATRFVNRLLFGKSKGQVTYTENEVEALIDTVAEDNALPPEHGSLIRSAYGVTALHVSDIETSWKHTSKLPLDADRDTVVSVARSVQHTRFPVIENGVPVGVLHIRRYLRSCIEGESSDIGSVMTPPLFLDGDMPADHALAQMSHSKTSLAFVKRSGGEISGIVTVEDILEYLVGDMDDETDTEEKV